MWKGFYAAIGGVIGSVIGYEYGRSSSPTEAQQTSNPGMIKIEVREYYGPEQQLKIQGEKLVMPLGLNESDKPAMVRKGFFLRTRDLFNCQSVETLLTCQLQVNGVPEKQIDQSVFQDQIVTCAKSALSEHYDKVTKGRHLNDMKMAQANVTQCVQDKSGIGKDKIAFKMQFQVQDKVKQTNQE